MVQMPQRVFYKTNAEKARKNGDYSMTDAEIREYEAAVAESEQMSLEDLFN